MEQMMKDIVKKDSMYPPMKMMREELPKYLEENSEKLSIEDLERYNNQLDVINKICDKFENDAEDQEGVIKLLEELQEHGSPPDEMLTKIQEHQRMNMPPMGGLGQFGGFPGFPNNLGGSQ